MHFEHGQRCASPGRHVRRGKGHLGGCPTPLAPVSVKICACRNQIDISGDSILVCCTRAKCSIGEARHYLDSHLEMSWIRDLDWGGAPTKSSEVSTRPMVLNCRLDTWVLR